MKLKIDLITILTDNVSPMVEFYKNVLGFAVKTEMGEYFEFENEGVRFAICKRKVLLDCTKEERFAKPISGQNFELAFPLESPEEVNRFYKEIIQKGATPIKEPADMPWGQRTGFFADPDGNVHEIFAGLN